MNKILKESFLWILVLLPLIYLAAVYAKLPDIVPTHFDFNGKPNDYSSKTTLIFIVAGMALGNYLLMLVIPFLDPKNKLMQMGIKYFNLRFILQLFMALLGMFIIYISKEGSLKNPNMLFALIGAIFAILGNYFQTVRPNYFIGIRTPWTLEGPETWKKTHRLGGRIWMVGGILIALLSFVITNSSVFTIIFFTLMGIMVLVPVVYSYFAFQEEKKNLNE